MTLFDHKCMPLVANSTGEIPIEFQAVCLSPMPTHVSLPPLVITQHGVCERMLSGHSGTLGAQ